MIRRFCDCCDVEMTDANTPKMGANHGRLETTIQRKGKQLSVEVIQSLDGTSNTGDVCRHCILDALYKLDDRPRVRPA